MSRYPSQRHWVGGPPEGACYPWESGTSHSGDEGALFENKYINKQRIVFFLRDFNLTRSVTKKMFIIKQSLI